MSHVKPGDHGTTFGGGALVSAAALSVLDVILEPTFLGDVRRKSEFLMGKLRAMKGGKVADVRGLGLLVRGK